MSVDSAAAAPSATRVGTNKEETSQQDQHIKIDQSDTNMKGDESADMDVSSKSSSSSSAPSSSSPSLPSGFPSCLHTEGYSYGVRILHDRLTVVYTHRSMHLLDVGTVRSNLPIPKPRGDAVTGAASTGSSVGVGSNLYYFEIEIQSIGEKNQITIGIAPLQSACLFAPSNMQSIDTPTPTQASLRQHDTASLTCRQVGMDNLSYGYRGDDGKKYHGHPIQSGRPGPPSAGVAYGPPFVVGDIIGCGVNYWDSTIFFTRNGNHLGTAFTINTNDWLKCDSKECRDPIATPINARLDFYAAVSLHSQGEQVKFNFGATPFAFDVSGLSSTEQQRVRALISSRPLDSSVMLPMIRSYLIAQGYEKSLEEINKIANGSGGNGNGANTNDKQSANGTYDAAMTDASSSSSASSGSAGAAAVAPASVLAASSSAALAASSLPLTVHDALAFSSMSRRRAIRDLIESGHISDALTAIGHLAPDLFTEGDTPSRTMIPEPRTINTIRLRLHALQFIQILSASDRDSSSRLVDAVSFAQSHFTTRQLQQDPAAQEAINQLMGLLAYADVTTSPLAHLTQPAYRDQIADEVNSALLTYLCTPAGAHSNVHGMSSLELVVRHACAVDGILKQGYPVAMPSIRDTCRQQE